MGQWSSQRNQTTYEESKRVMKGQKSDIDDMDDKALRTVRLTAAILAIGATGVEILETEEMNLLLTGFSIIFLVSSAIFGVIVYNESDILVGPKASYLKTMRTNQQNPEWEQGLLIQMEQWITANQRRVELNGALLNICQLFFILGIIVGIIAIVGPSVENLQTKEWGILVVVTLSMYYVVIWFLRRNFKEYRHHRT